MKKLNTLCYVLALCSCMSCNSQNNTNSKSQATTAASKNKNLDANVLRMQLSSIKDNQVTKGDAVLFLLPQGWKQQSQLDWDAQNTQFPASAYLHVNNLENTAQLHIYKTSFYTLFHPLEHILLQI